MSASIKSEGRSYNSMTVRKNLFEEAFQDHKPGYMIRRINNNLEWGIEKNETNETNDRILVSGDLHTESRSRSCFR